MSIGSQTSTGNVNSSLTQLALNLRGVTAEILQQWAYLNKLGLAGLQALGFTAADAQAVLDAVNHMATVAQVYRGTATQGSLFNFEDSLTSLWAGQ
jgi:hypothetical protein